MAGKPIRLIAVFSFAVLALIAADDDKSAPSGPASSAAPANSGGTSRSAVPPVMRRTEPEDSHFVLLPGPPVSTPAPAPSPVKAFTPPAPAGGVKAEVSESHEPPPPELIDPGRPILRRAPRPFFPEDFEADSGLFCQKQIGKWKELDALTLLGEPSSDRPAFDDSQAVNGRIFAFSDPTNHYRQLELDFDGETGALRTVFVYPWKMTWQDCRRIWGTNVSAAEAAKGRKFYSYLNRRLDVLVDASGKVISIGLY